MKNFKNKRKILFVLLSFLITAIIIVVVWDLNGYLVMGHDVGYRLNIKEFFHNLFFLWSDSLNFGENKYYNPGAIPIHVPELLFTIITGNVFLGQKITLIYWHFLMLIPLVFAYFLFSKNSEYKKMFIFFILGSYLYAINFFNLQGWGVFWRTRFSIQIVLPILFIFLYKTLDEKKLNKIHLLFIVLTSAFLNGGGSPPLFGPVVITWIITGIYFLILENDKKKVVMLFTKTTFFFGIGFILISSYWLYPTLQHFLSSFRSEIASVGGIEGVTQWLKVVSKDTSYINLFRLQGIPSWGNTAHPYASTYTTNTFYIILSYIWPVLAFSSLLLAETLKEKKLVLLVALLGLIGIFFASGAHPPLGWAFELMVKYIPGFTMFRTAFYKFAPLVWFSYTFLAAFSLYRIGIILNKKFKHVFIFWSYIFIVGIFVIVYHAPFFSGNFFQWDEFFSTKVKPPDYIFHFQEWVNKNQINGRIVLLPKLENTYYADSYKWGYWGRDPLPNLLSSRNTLVGNTGDQLTDALVTQLHEAVLASDHETLGKLSRLLDVEYLLLREDAYYDFPQRETIPPIVYKEALKRNTNIEIEEIFNKWILYKIKTYIPSRIRVASGIDLIVGDKTFFNTEVDLVNENEVLTGEAFTADKIDMEDYSKIIILPSKIEYNSNIDPFSAIHVRLYPDSIFYRLKEYKNKKDREKNITIYQKIDFSLNLLVKKVEELEYLEAKNKAEYLSAHIKTIQEELDLLEKSMGSIRDFNKENYEKKMKIDHYLGELVKRISMFYQQYLDENILIINKINMIRSKLGLNRNECADECSLYDIKVPLRGEYKFIINEESLAEIENIKFNTVVYSPSTENNQGRLGIIKNYVLREGSYPLEIRFKEHVLSNQILLEPEKSYVFPIRSTLKNYMVAFNYDIKGEDTYLLTKKIRNSISGFNWSRTIALKGKDDYKERFNLSEGVALESIVFSSYQEKRNKNQQVSEINNVRIVSQADADVTFYRVLNERMTYPKTTQYQKINPSQWDISIAPENNDPVILSFSNLYNAGWIIKNGEYRHIKINGNLNGWLLPVARKKEVIYFLPQDHLKIGFIISGLSLLGIIVYLIKNILAKQKNEHI